MAKVITVGAGIVEQDGKILIARRGPKAALAGKWEFPGGKVEPGETAEECIVRELHEEFGVETRVGAFLTATTYHYPDGAIRLVAHHVEHVSGDWIPLEHAEIRWVRIDDLPSYALAPADIPVMEALLASASDQLP